MQQSKCNRTYPYAHLTQFNDQMSLKAKTWYKSSHVKAKICKERERCTAIRITLHDLLHNQLTTGFIFLKWSHTHISSILFPIPDGVMYHHTMVKIRDAKWYQKLMFSWKYIHIECGSGSLVSIATELRAGRSRVESWWGWNFPPIQTGPGAHPASCKMGIGSFPGVKSVRGVLLTTHPILVPWSWKSRAIPLPTLWATLGPVTGSLYLHLFLHPHWILTSEHFPYVTGKTGLRVQ